jgi:3-hydroxyacyl-[acyl-carrier-protein] dehydratase
VDIALDIKEIQRLLPHRYPFLLVDRVVEIQVEKSLKAYKNVSMNEQFFQGHFPGHPVMPGVLMVEALAQAAALLAFKSTGVEGAGLVYLTGLDGVRFRRPVVPGDRLDLEVSVLKRKSRIWKMRGEASVNGQLACEAELMATVPDAVGAAALAGPVRGPDGDAG